MPLAVVALAMLSGHGSCHADEPALRGATFSIDATPPMGTPLCDALVGPATAVDDPLSIRGVVLVPRNEKPIVLLALDWVGIGNAGYDVWRQGVADAAGTSADRVALHSLHQHDAPGCDYEAEAIAVAHGLGGHLYDLEFANRTLKRLEEAVQAATGRLEPITHIGAGQGKVEKVASTRRCLGPDGRVEHVRYTTCQDPAIRAYPEGVIDPYAKAISFWNGEKPLAVLTYYATHPQTPYGKGRVSADIPGAARAMREAELPGPMHIHFNGAGGNLGAGKYNDGSPGNRELLGGRMAAGFKAAWETMDKFPVDGVPIDWAVTEVVLPPAAYLDEQDLLQSIDDENSPLRQRLMDVRNLAWLKRCQEKHPIELSRLRIGSVDLVHMPGELFVEYQLAAQSMRPDSTVCMAAYGDYGPGYIGLAKSYAEGGYETSEASRVAPAVESVLMKGMADLLR